MHPTQPPADDEYPMVSAEEFERDSEMWMAEAEKCGGVRVVEPDGQDVVVLAAWKHQQLEVDAEFAAAMERILSDD